MLEHYIAAHRYKPPDAFIFAAIESWKHCAAHPEERFEFGPDEQIKMARGEHLTGR